MTNNFGSEPALRLYDRIEANPQILRGVGALARAKARQAGVPFYYEDSALGEGIVEEMPDGSRRLLTTLDEQQGVGGTSSPP